MAWFCLRLLAEYLTINGLIFEGSKVQPVILLNQIVQLSDVDPSKGITSFDYYHASISTLLNKGKPTLVGVTRLGRTLVLIYLGMILGLYALTFARILQLTRALV